MAKKITYPSWIYKSRVGFLKSKEKEWGRLISAADSLMNGCAFLSPKMRAAIQQVFDNDREIAKPYFKKAIKREELKK